LEINMNVTAIVNLIKENNYAKANIVIKTLLSSKTILSFEMQKIIDKLIEFLCDFNSNRQHIKALKIYELLNLFEEYIKDLKKKNIILNEYEIAQGICILKSKPRFLQVVLTTKCNLDCIMCGLPHTNYTLSENFKKNIIEYIPFLENVIWQGGEPLLYKDFIEFFSISTQFNVHQAITTNGLLIDESFLEIINNSESKVNLDISIDSVNKYTYEKIRRRASFDLLMSKINLITKKINFKKNFIFGMQVVIMKSNYKQIADMIDFALDKGFNKIMFQMLYPGYLAQNEVLDVEANNFVCDCINKYETKIHSSKLNFGIQNNIKRIDINEDILSANTNNINNLHKQSRELFCLAPWKRLFIGKNNIVMPVCHCDVEGKTVNETFDLWNGDSMIYFRQKMLEKKEPNQCKTFCLNSGQIFENIRRSGK